MQKTGKDRQEAAETLALQALSWIAANEEVFPVFLASTGASAAEIAVDAAKPEFLASVMDFLLSDDVWIAGFCDATDLPYGAPLLARAALPGGEQINWT